MSLRIATFNVENLMNRFDFSGFRNQLNQDRTLALYQIKDEAEYRLLEQGRAVAHTDDTRQLTALAIADTRADIIAELDRQRVIRGAVVRWAVCSRLVAVLGDVVAVGV